MMHSHRRPAMRGMAAFHPARLASKPSITGLMLIGKNILQNVTII
jgi:hypothetical protein